MSKVNGSLTLRVIIDVMNVTVRISVIFEE